MLLRVFPWRELRRRCLLLLLLYWRLLHLSLQLHLGRRGLLLLLCFVDNLLLSLRRQLLLLLRLMVLMHMRATASVGFMACGLSSSRRLYVWLRLLLLRGHCLLGRHNSGSGWQLLLLLLYNRLRLLYHRRRLLLHLHLSGCHVGHRHLHFLSGCNT